MAWAVLPGDCHSAFSVSQSWSCYRDNIWSNRYKLLLKYYINNGYKSARRQSHSRPDVTLVYFAVAVRYQLLHH